MGSQASTPVETTSKRYPVQKGIFNLDTFEPVLVKKEYEFTPVTSFDEMLQRIGNDSKKALEIINDGLRTSIHREMWADPEGWQIVNDEGEMSGPFTGTLADEKKVNALVLTLAKTVFGYSKDMTSDDKKAAKNNAMEMVKNTKAIRDGLVKSAAMSASDATEEE